MNSPVNCSVEFPVCELCIYLECVCSAYLAMDSMLIVSLLCKSRISNKQMSITQMKMLYIHTVVVSTLLGDFKVHNITGYSKTFSGFFS